jgi:hexokinase
MRWYDALSCTVCRVRTGFTSQPVTGVLQAQGGTNLRVLHVQLQPGRDATVRSKAFTVSSAIMTGPGQDLFAFLASCVAESLEELLG